MRKIKKDSRGWFKDQFDGWVREATMDERPLFIKAKTCQIIRVAEGGESSFCGDTPNVRWRKDANGSGELISDPKLSGLCEGHYNWLYGDEPESVADLPPLDKQALIASMKEHTKVEQEVS